MAEQTRIRVLGTLEIDVQGKGSTTLAQPRRTALLLYLALATPAGAHSRDLLLGLFWPEAPRARARSALNSAVHYLRRHLSAGAIVGGTGQLEIDASIVVTDATRFEEALRSGDRERALSLYEGDLAPGFHVDGAPGFERWLDERRSQLHRQARAAADELMKEAEAAGDPHAAARWATTLVRIAPDDESVIREVMQVLHRSGQPAEAQRCFEVLERYLRADFDMAPSPETVQLARGLRDSRAPAAAASDGVPAAAARAHGRSGEGTRAVSPVALDTLAMPAPRSTVSVADHQTADRDRETSAGAGTGLRQALRLRIPIAAVAVVLVACVMGISRWAASGDAGEGSTLPEPAGGAASAATAAFQRGETAYRQGRFREAETEFRRAAELDSGMVVAALRYSQSANWTGNEPGVVWGLLRAQERSDGLGPPR